MKIGRVSIDPPRRAGDVAAPHRADPGSIRSGSSPAVDEPVPARPAPSGRSATAGDSPSIAGSAQPAAEWTRAVGVVAVEPGQRRPSGPARRGPARPGRSGRRPSPSRSGTPGRRRRGAWSGRPARSPCQAGELVDERGTRVAGSAAGASASRAGRARRRLSSTEANRARPPARRRPRRGGAAARAARSCLAAARAATMLRHSFAPRRSGCSRSGGASGIPSIVSATAARSRRASRPPRRPASRRSTGTTRSRDGRISLDDERHPVGAATIRSDEPAPATPLLGRLARRRCLLGDRVALVQPERTAAVRRRPPGRHQEDRDRGRQAGHRRVAPAPAPGPLGRPDRPGQDRLAGQEPAEVLGQAPRPTA